MREGVGRKRGISYRSFAEAIHVEKGTSSMKAIQLKTPSTSTSGSLMWQLLCGALILMVRAGYVPETSRLGGT